MGRTTKRARRKRREIRTQPTFQLQRRAPHSVVPVDRAADDADNEFDHSDDWLTPYEPADEAL